MSKYKGEKISFRPGYESLPLNKVADVKCEIMSLLSITTKQSWHRYLRGEVYITPEMKRDISKVFNRNKIRVGIWTKC